MGRVADATGSGLPGVRVEVAVPGVADATLLEITDVAVTNSTGWFEATHLRAGSYMVSFSLQGFDTVVSQDVWVGAACVTTLDAHMQERLLRTGLVTVGDSSGGARPVHRALREVPAHGSPPRIAQEQSEIAPAATPDHNTPLLAHPPWSRSEDESCRESNPLWIGYLSWLPPPHTCRLAKLPMLGVEQRDESRGFSRSGHPRLHAKDGMSRSRTVCLDTVIHPPAHPPISEEHEDAVRGGHRRSERLETLSETADRRVSG